ncbi:MAG TPA: carboxypeptidase-like regulatory domain-containing protein [Planctomicrobium sp.]|nr:carboxypeptidase-like regulatory domain-containing protein [Planctomicrobium sp.]
MKPLQLLFAAAILFLFAVGCSRGTDYGETGTISGRLTLSGEPLVPGHAVLFMEPLKGFIAFGQTDANGLFQIDSWNQGKMPVGMYQVQIIPPAAREQKSQRALSTEEQFENPESPVRTADIRFPKKYCEFKTSGLQYEITSGKNTFEIDLEPQSNPKKK